MIPAPALAAPGWRQWLDIALVFLRLGLTSFGGPIAHLGYFRAEFVERRRWVSEAVYADLVALCQFLPGPASSQVGIALGALRAGLPGAVAAWLGFTLPSAAIMIGFAYGLDVLPGTAHAGWLHGLKLAAVAVVAQAVWNMGRQLCPTLTRASFAAVSAALVLSFPGAATQILAIAAAGLGGRLILHASPMLDAQELPVRLSRRLSAGAWIVFFALLVLLPAAVHWTANHATALFNAFYRSGALVFGGGHVLLPLLREAVVAQGWIGDDAFLAGYGAAQAVPGPLTTFAAYLGSAIDGVPNGWAGGLFALIAIFLPSFLLVIGALPHWDQWRKRPSLRSALAGINAGVVGILLAALYNPIFVTAVRGWADFGLAVAGFVLLVFAKARPLLVVVFSAVGGSLLMGWS